MSYSLKSVAVSQDSTTNTAINGLLQGRYCLLNLIGQGGFGKTFLAVDQSQPSQPYCVIKQILSVTQTLKQRRQANFLHQEGLRLAELGKHPQVPTLLGVFEQDGQGYLVQEFIDGQTLEQELVNSGCFNASEICELLNQLLPVLQFIHDRQVIHRDIKPANIIRRRNGQLVLVDFGAAKAYSEDRPIQTGTLIGSAEYAAPEQTRGRAIFASDLYSLGVTCIHLLTQMPPFDLFDDGEDNWNWRDFLPHSIDASLAHILDRLVCSSINLRYHSAIEVIEDLNRHKQLANAGPVLSFLPQTTRPAHSTTVFVPSTQEWYYVSAATEASNFTYQVAKFVSPHLAVARFPVDELGYENADVESGNRIDLVWWIVNPMLMSATAVTAIVVIILAMKPYLSINALKVEKVQPAEIAAKTVRSSQPVLARTE